MDNDDKTLGRILSRREVLALLGATGTGLAAGRLFGQRPGDPGPALPALSSPVSPMPSCVVRPEQTEGPYFVDEGLRRSDIRSDPSSGSVSEGVPLDLEILVSRVASGGCQPLAGALVDIWQCDALGVYSDVRDTNGLFDTRGKKFLRGHLLTDAKGRAAFTTIFPGWYQGRTTHIHFKVRVERDGGGGRAFDFTSQLYFDDAESDRVFARGPYAQNRQRRVKNDQDGIFRQGGRDLVTPIRVSGTGLATSFAIGLDLG